MVVIHCKPLRTDREQLDDIYDEPVGYYHYDYLGWLSRASYSGYLYHSGAATTCEDLNEGGSMQNYGWGASDYTDHAGKHGCSRKIHMVITLTTVILIMK